MRSTLSAARLAIETCSVSLAFWLVLYCDNAVMAATSTANSAKIEYSLAASENRDAMTPPENEEREFAKSAAAERRSAPNCRRYRQSVLNFDGHCLNARSPADCN